MCVCVCAGARARVYVYSLYIQLKLSNLLPLICAPPYRRYRLLKDCMWHMYHFNFARLRLNCAQAVFRNWLKYHLKVAVRYRFTNTSTAFFSFTLLPRAIFRNLKRKCDKQKLIKIHMLCVAKHWLILQIQCFTTISVHFSFYFCTNASMWSFSVLTQQSMLSRVIRWKILNKPTKQHHALLTFHEI